MPFDRLSRRNFLGSAIGSVAVVAAGSPFFLTPELRAERPMPPHTGTDQASQALNLAAAINAPLDNFISDYMDAMNAPGFTLGLADRSATLRTAGYGYANIDQRLPVSIDHLFEIGSITKSFVALVILQLRDEGKLDLHRPVLEYLPALPIVTEFGAVTVHHLLTHSSGLPDNLSLFSADPAARLVQGFAPGAHFHYCNAGFDMLGLLVAKLDGRPWRIAVSERILKPLGMEQTTPIISTAARDRSATGYQPYWDNEEYPRQGKLAQAPILVMDDTAGCIASTPGDMARYAQMLLNRGQAPKGRIVSEESFALFSMPHIKAEEFSPTASYGYGIAVDTLDGHKILRHTGGMVAFASSIHVDLDGGVAAFASINAMQGYRPTAVTEYAVRLLRAESESKPLPAAPAIHDPQEIDNAADYAGTFTADDGRKLVFVAKGKRLALVDGQKEIPLQRHGTDSFISTVANSFARFPFRFGRKEGVANSTTSSAEVAPQPVVEVSYGPEWFPSAAYTGPREFSVPRDFEIFTGFYRSDSPWGGGSDVYVLKGRLLLDGEPLVRLGAGIFRLGEEDWSPLTVQFLHLFEGKMRLARVAGTDCWRLEVE
jgi:D-alanyl-D-alanine carboxypeptidase